MEVKKEYLPVVALGAGVIALSFLNGGQATGPHIDSVTKITNAGADVITLHGHGLGPVTVGQQASVHFTGPGINITHPIQADIDTNGGTQVGLIYSVLTPGSYTFQFTDETGLASNIYTLVV